MQRSAVPARRDLALRLPRLCQRLLATDRDIGAQDAVVAIDAFQVCADEIYRGKLVFQPEFLFPISKKQILRRMLNNLKAIYLRQGDFVRSLTVVERLLILEPNSAQEIRDRGIVYLKLECFAQALEDLESYIRLSSHADDAAEIREQVVSLRKLVTRMH